MKKWFLKFYTPSSLSRGFSLIELSVIVSVAATAAVGFLAWTQPKASTDAALAIVTNNKINDIQRAIESFRVQRKRLPCPADQTIRSDGTSATTSQAGFGAEGLTLQAKCNNIIGAVPAFALGLDESYMNDGWGRRFTYQVSDSVCSMSRCDSISYKSGTGNITVSEGSSSVTNAAYVLVSHGANGSGAYLPSGQRIANSKDTNELNNVNGYGSATPNKIYIKAIQSRAFDDIVVFKTKNMIESITNRRTMNSISVADCEANSQTLKNITLSETNIMQTSLSAIASQTNDAVTADQGILGVLKATQSICISYYGVAASTIGGRTWSGAQCPGNKNPAVNGSTYYDTTDTCTCKSGLWDGNCTFTPPYASGMKLWLDSSDYTTLYSDINCSLAANENNTVGCWKDKSGGGNDATGDQGPTLASPQSKSAINGKPVLLFNGTSSNLANSSFSLLNTLSIFAVISPGSAAGYKTIINNDKYFYLGTGSNTNYFASFYGNGSPWTVTDHGAGGSMASGTSYLLISINDGANNKSYINDSVLPVMATSMTASTGYKIGMNSIAAAQYWDGSIGEILIYNTALSNNQITAIKTYLGAKWGI